MTVSNNITNATAVLGSSSYSQLSIVLVLLFCIAFIATGIFGNVITIVALLKNTKLKSAATSWFVISLSATDLLFCSFCLPLTAVRYAHQAWPMGSLLCRLFPFFFYLNVAASLFNMMALSINRYFLVAHYTKYASIYTAANVAFMIVGCWLIPLLILFPTLIEKWGQFGYNPKSFSCTILKDSSGHSPKSFLFLFGVLLPCSVIILCYIGIFYTLRKSSRTLALYSRTNSGSEPKKREHERSLVRTFIFIFGAFLVCYVPLLCANVFETDHKLPLMHLITSVLAWSASVLNPFIYGITNRKYRKAYLAVLPCCQRFLTRNDEIGTITDGSNSTHVTSQYALTSHTSINELKYMQSQII